MVVSALVQLAIAGPTGILFGLGYGTAIRVGYEIVFPALFGNKEIAAGDTKSLDKIEQIYTAIGGLEAHKFGINQGIKNALKEIEADPELVELIKKNLFNDTQNITVNLSGSSNQGSDKDLFPSSGSSGKSAELHRKLRAHYDAIELENKKAAHKVIQQAYTTAVKGIIEIRFNGNWTLGWLTTLLKGNPQQVTIPGGTWNLTSYPTVTIHYGFLTLSYQQTIVNEFNKLNDAARETAEGIKSTQKKFLPAIFGIRIIGSWLYVEEFKNMRKTRQRMEDWAQGFIDKGDGSHPAVQNKKLHPTQVSKWKVKKIAHQGILNNWDRLRDV